MRRLSRSILVPTAFLTGVVVVALAFLLWSSAREARELERDAEAIRDATALAMTLADAENEEDRWVQSLPISPDRTHEARIATAGERVRRLSSEVNPATLSPRAAAVWAQYLETREALRPIAAQLLHAARRGDRAAVALALGRWHLMGDRADRLLGSFSAYHLNKLDRTVADLQRRRARALGMAGTAIAAGLLLALAFAVLVTRRVVHPIVEMSSAARQVEATGTAALVRGADRRDELGVLARAFNAMTARLVSTNATLAAANERLAEADRRKDEFLAVLSHELRNPLAPVKNGLYLLERAPPGSDAARRAQEIIARQIDHLTHLVDDLLDVTRITRGKIQLQRQRLELNEAARRAIEDHRTVFDRARVTVRLEAAPTPVAVMADPHRIAQVLGNLLLNAAKFTPPGGGVTVTVSQRAEAGAAVLRVADSGAGMTPEVLARVFEPFVQADTTLDRSKGGLGLGLALVRGLVEQHGGSVEARSEGLGRGAEFVVRLPLDAGKDEPRARDQAVPVAPRRRVLVIEDLADSAESLRGLLEAAGHEVAVAYDGPSGIVRGRAFRPEVVLCDIGLPGMDGYEVARAFRADEALRCARLVALTGYARPEDVQRAVEAGFDRHLAKPASPDAIAAVLVGEAAAAAQQA